MQTVLVKEGTVKENPLCLRLAPRRDKALTSAENDMWIALRANFKTCLVHGPRHASDECHVLRDFGAK